MNQAKAAVAMADANVKTLTLTEKNKKDLYNNAIISSFEYETAVNQLMSAKASLAQAEASLVSAEQNLSFCKVTSPSNEMCIRDRGITAVLVKYRVPRREGHEKHEAPLQDLQRAIGYVRAHAEEMNVDPQRIGVMGFSAGGHLSAMVSNNFEKRTYPAVDAADKVSCRPDFCLLVYPAYLDGENFQLAPEIKVTSATPPTMLIQACLLYTATTRSVT